MFAQGHTKSVNLMHPFRHTGQSSTSHFYLISPSILGTLRAESGSSVSFSLQDSGPGCLGSRCWITSNISWLPSFASPLLPALAKQDFEAIWAAGGHRQMETVASHAPYDG